MGEFFDTYKNPTHICVLMLLHDVWIVATCDNMHLITGYVICWSLYDITSYVICCAKRQFPPFLPASSISQPPSWKILSVSKTPENSTLRAYLVIIGINPIKIDWFFQTTACSPEISNCINWLVQRWSRTYYVYRIFW